MAINFPYPPTTGQLYVTGSRSWTYNGTSWINTSYLTASFAGTSSWSVNPQSYTFNVKSYGATGNGITDDTAAISASAAALGTAGFGTLFFPDGRYKISSTIVIAPPSGTYVGVNNTHQFGYTVKGNGRHSSVLIQQTQGQGGLYIAVPPWPGRQDNSNAEVSNLAIRTAGTISGSTAIYIDYGPSGSVSSEDMGPTVINAVDISADNDVGVGTEGGFLNGIVVNNPWKLSITDINATGLSNVPNLSTISSSFISIYGGINVNIANVYGSYYNDGIAIHPFSTLLNNAIGSSSLAAEGYNICNMITVCVIRAVKLYGYGWGFSGLTLSDFVFDQGNGPNSGSSTVGSITNYGIYLDASASGSLFSGTRGQVSITNGQIVQYPNNPYTSGSAIVFNNVGQATVSNVIAFQSNPFASLTNGTNNTVWSNNNFGGGGVTIDSTCSNNYFSNNVQMGVVINSGSNTTNLLSSGTSGPYYNFPFVGSNQIITQYTSSGTFGGGLNTYSTTLDEYCAGTWVPTGNGFTTSSTVTYSGTFTKIGKLVFINVQVGTTGNTSGSFSSTAGSSFFLGAPWGLGNTRAVGQAIAGNLSQTGPMLYSGTALLFPTITNYVVCSSLGNYVVGSACYNIM